MSIDVKTAPIGAKLHSLLMFADRVFIGEYERSQAADIERKKAEIEESTDLLLALFRQYGELSVRWDGNRRVKSIRSRDIEVGVIPKSAWKPPSWSR